MCNAWYEKQSTEDHALCQSNRHTRLLHWSFSSQNKIADRKLDGERGHGQKIERKDRQSPRKKVRLLLDSRRLESRVAVDDDEGVRTTLYFLLKSQHLGNVQKQGIKDTSLTREKLEGEEENQAKLVYLMKGSPALDFDRYVVDELNHRDP